MKFNKRPTSLEEQVALLKSRGVEIDNDSTALILSRVNYYRFCGYGLYFEEFDDDGNRLNKFLPGTTFNRIYNLYLWDEKLKNLLQKYLGCFEIMFRSTLNYVMVTETQNPFWILAENLSFGKWSKLFGALKHFSHIKAIASRLKAPPRDLVSWVRSLVILRNRCAHHGRLWGYQFKIKPSRTPTMQRLQLGNDSVGALIYILHDLLRVDECVQREMAQSFNELVLCCPESFEKYLGLSTNFRL